ncbi:hypothetical protein [Streptococcus sp. 20-1249]|uniref:hypothetical protein n=1 Tax=Streptococcus hepaticus TaxID=3349163 RepID=UPI003749CF7C
MKKVILFCSVVISSLCFSICAKAATPKEIDRSIINSAVDENQIVQVLPEGGYIVNIDGSSNFDESLVEYNNGTLMKYSDYRLLDAIDTSLPSYPFPFFRSASPDKAVQNPKILANGETYRSQPFSGKGWRFSELKFKAKPSTGSWLLWTSIGDSGLVGNEWEAYRTYQGTRTYRAALESIVPQYVNGDNSWLFYYTFDPVIGSKYEVSNS